MKYYKNIRISKANLKILENWAKECYPNEAPALLIGNFDDEKEVAIVTDVYPMENIEKSPVSFQIDPEEYYKIYKIAEENGKHIIGVFHSHPMDPIPSGVDMPYLKLHRNIWVILSTTQKIDNIKAYQWYNEQVRPVKIEIFE